MHLCSPVWQIQDAAFSKQDIKVVFHPACIISGIVSKIEAVVWWRTDASIAQAEYAVQAV